MDCPECQKALKEMGGQYACTDCNKQFAVSFTCQVCGAVPEEISSCGSVGYFCNACNELRSRTAMNKDFTVQE